MKRKPFWLALIIFTILVTIPYLIAYVNGGEDHVFGGFLINPQDGNSYLAKMEEGWQGEWKFTLPFSAEKSDGAFLFLFYILLGHIARFTGSALILVFHVTRLICSIFLLFSLAHFTDWIFRGKSEFSWWAFLLSLFGSGLGWLFVLAGLITSDMWVVETFPFLSGFASPHFSLGMGILFLMFIDLAGEPSAIRLIRLAVYGFIMAVVMPFGIVVVGCIGVVWTLSEWITTRKFEIRPFTAGLIFGGPSVLYQFLAVQQDPLLSIWNNQNITQSPPVWDLLIAFSPAIIFAVLGLLEIIKLSSWSQSTRLLVIWFVLGAIMIYFPFSLQRRFMFSYFVPVCCLAVVGIQSFRKSLGKFSERLFPVVFSLSVITNVFVVLLAVFGIVQKSPLLYLTRDEFSAFEYLKKVNSKQVVVLCAPDTGSYIPGWTGDRVIYGHEFETANAGQNEIMVKEIYSGRLPANEAVKYLQQQEVKYVFWGPREKKLGTAEFLNSLTPVYKNGTVEIFSW